MGRGCMCAWLRREPRVTACIHSFNFHRLAARVSLRGPLPEALALHTAVCDMDGMGSTGRLLLQLLFSLVFLMFCIHPASLLCRTVSRVFPPILHS